MLRCETGWVTTSKTRSNVLKYSSVSKERDVGGGHGFVVMVGRWVRRLPKPHHAKLVNATRPASITDNHPPSSVGYDLVLLSIHYWPSHSFDVIVFIMPPIRTEKRNVSPHGLAAFGFSKVVPKEQAFAAALKVISARQMTAAEVLACREA